MVLTPKEVGQPLPRPLRRSAHHGGPQVRQCRRGIASVEVLPGFIQREACDSVAGLRPQPFG
jgi:hypothetical protein